MKSFIRVQIVMGIVKKTRYEYYFLRELRYPNIAKAILLKRLEQLRRFVNFVDNDTFDGKSLNKRFKIQPLIYSVQQ